MPTDYIPATDGGLLSWAQNFSTLITADPVVYGLTAGLATTLAGKVTAYDAALTAATNPATRGGSTILAKDVAKVDLVAYCRLLAGTIQGTIGVTDVQKFDLGLTVRDRDPSPIPPPNDAPDIDIVSVIGRTVRIRLHEAGNAARRGKPAGVAGAAVFSYVGETAPTTPSAWRFEGNTTRTNVNIVFPDTVAGGAKVWITAFWFNAKAQSGPGTEAVSTTLQGGVVAAAA